MTPTEKQKRYMRRCLAMESSNGETPMTYSKMQKIHNDSDSQLFESSDYSVGDRVTLHLGSDVSEIHKPNQGRNFHGQIVEAGNSRSHLPLLVSGKRDSRTTAAAELIEPRKDYEHKKYILGHLRNTGNQMSTAEHHHRSVNMLKCFIKCCASVIRLFNSSD